MKTISTTLSALCVACAALVATAHAELKVASVNMLELRSSFYKMSEADASINKFQEDIKKEIAAREEKIRALDEERKKIASSIDPTLSDSAAKAQRSKYEATVSELQAAANEYETFRKRREAALSEVARRELILIANDIHEAVSAVAKEGGYDLVVDSSAASASTGYKVIPFVKPELDITEAVAKKLNADAPEGFDYKAVLERLRAAQSAAPAAPAEQGADAQ